MPKYNENNITEKQIFENKDIPDDIHQKYLERQKMLKAEMQEDMIAAIDGCWYNPERRSELIGICEKFSRKANQLGTGVDNALCIAARLGKSASCLVSSLETTQKEWRKKLGVKAVTVLQFESTKNGTYQTAIRAFDISQLEGWVLDNNRFDAPPHKMATAKEIVLAVNLMQDAWDFKAYYNTEGKPSEFIPRDGDEPAKLVLSNNLTEQEIVQDVAYLFSHLIMSHQPDYQYTPETDFSARVSADFICQRYGFAPKLVGDPPKSISTKSQAKEFLTAAIHKAQNSAAWLDQVITRYREREQVRAQPEESVER